MVSIIIPCYNIRNYIATTINSVLSQTDSNWEIIAVNDGSSDLTLEILRDFENSYDRIKVYHQENKGVSSARNFGLTKAKGDWVYFLDGDDLIAEDLVATINNSGRDNDMLVFDFVREKEGKIIKTYKITRPKTLFIDYLTNRQSIHISSVATKREYIMSNNVSFDESTSYGEDREFIANLFLYNPIYKHIAKTAFRYQYRADSAINNTTYSRKRFTSVLATERTYRSQKDPAVKKKALAILAFTIAWHLKMFYECGCDDVELESRLKRYSDRYLKGVHCYGLGHIELYTAIAGVMAFNSNVLRLFLKLT